MITHNRLIAVDYLRGATIAAMLVVNFPGNEAFVYPTLRHSAWNGLTFTDIIAPFFLFIVGVSIALAFTRKISTGVKPGSLHSKISIRAVKIFAVGMFLNLLPDFDVSDLRWTGTLHRISIVYLVTALLFLHTTWKQQIWIAVVILVGYWLAMTLIPTPGYGGAVMLEPGKNLAAWIDSKWLPGKMWQGTWDPEGILSTFPAIVTGITGIFAGNLLLSRLPEVHKAAWLMTAGMLSAALGYWWGLTFPVNENLWTSSFVLVTSGFAALVSGAAYFLIDLQGYRRFTKGAVIFGSNAITAYVMADIFALVCYIRPFGTQTLNLHFTGLLTRWGMTPELSSLTGAVCFVGICFLPVWWLYHRKIFIRL